MFDLRHFTLILIAVLGFGIGGGDYLLFKLGLNRSTISRVFLDFEGYRPYAAPLIAYACSVLVWHLTVPTFAPMPPLWVSLARAFAVLAPIFFLFIQLGTSQPSTDDGFIRNLANREYGLSAMVIVGMVLGSLAGKYLVPQHM